jgi:hypothetical protein
VYDYDAAGEPVVPFHETHPAVMKDKIQQQNWQFQPDASLKYASGRDRLKRVVFHLTGWYPGEYKNYKLI